MKFVLVVIGIFVASAAFAQNSTTNTNCQAYGNNVNCTSNTTTNTPSPDPWANTSKQIQESSQRLSAALAANAQRRAEERGLESQIEFHVVYCQQNPNNSITTTAGERISCTEEFARMRALCSIGKNGKKYKFCKLLANAPAFAAAAQPAAMTSSATAPASPPISQSPAPSVTGVPTPTAPQTPEQKDAASFCHRNPTATITWNDGRVSPCSSLLADR